MGPTIIYNSQVTKSELRQYLDQLGVLNIADRLEALRRNPYRRNARKRHSDPAKEREEIKYKQALLTIRASSVQIGVGSRSISKGFETETDIDIFRFMKGI